jgi:hypothetical protein
LGIPVEEFRHLPTTFPKKTGTPEKMTSIKGRPLAKVTLNGVNYVVKITPI